MLRFLQESVDDYWHWTFGERHVERTGIIGIRFNFTRYLFFFFKTLELGVTKARSILH